MRLSFILCAAVLAAVSMGCSDNDTNSPAATAGFTVTITNLGQAYDYLVSGAFNTPVGAGSPGPVFQGGAYEFHVAGGPGSALSFATMYVQSNDLFYAPAGSGIPLFDAQGRPFTGDVTGQVMLWDAGVEANEEPGLGPNQAPRQPGPNTGPADPNSAVRVVDDGYTYPPVADALRVTVTHTGRNEFRVRIENLDPSSPIAPGVYVVHTAADPLFTAGQADRGQGLEAVAEDGNPATLGGTLAQSTGLTTPFAPGVYAVHAEGRPLFRVGSADPGYGLEALAEDGNAGVLAAYVEGVSYVGDSGAFTTPLGAAGPGPLFPGESYSFSFRATEGDRLSFATMLVQSNDLFVAPMLDAGIALFDGDGPVTGDITGSLLLWDAGTEINQFPGAGPDQAPRQSGPDTGRDDPTRRVRTVADAYTYPALVDLLEVTISSP